MTKIIIFTAGCSMLNVCTHRFSSSGLNVVLCNVVATRYVHVLQESQLILNVIIFKSVLQAQQHKNIHTGHHTQRGP